MEFKYHGKRTGIFYTYDTNVLVGMYMAGGYNGNPKEIVANLPIATILCGTIKSLAKVKPFAESLCKTYGLEDDEQFFKELYQLTKDQFLYTAKFKGTITVCKEIFDLLNEDEKYALLLHEQHHVTNGMSEKEADKAAIDAGFEKALKRGVKKEIYASAYAATHNGKYSLRLSKDAIVKHVQIWQYNIGNSQYSHRMYWKGMTKINWIKLW